MSQLLQSLEEKKVLNRRQVELYILLRSFVQDWIKVGAVRAYVKERAPELYQDFGTEFPWRYYSPTLEDDLRTLVYRGFLTRTLFRWGRPDEIKLGWFG